jgi:hypothetical protein
MKSVLFINFVHGKSWKVKNPKPTEEKNKKKKNQEVFMHLFRLVQD